MYRYGLLDKKWQAERQKLMERFAKSLGPDRSLFAQFFAPGQQEYGDKFDWELKQALEKTPQ
jgi:hypothetical protein